MPYRIDMSFWHGRIDSDDPKASKRWHQVAIPFDEAAWRASNVLIGFASDEGVRRNDGRIGAAEGPNSIRRLLANLAYEGDKSLYDAGNINCPNGDLGRAQADLGRSVARLLESDMNVTVLGGGREIAWGSFQGISRYLERRKLDKPRVGILNFDSRFNLQDADKETSAGTAFRQIGEWCTRHDWDFAYQVIGIDASAHTDSQLHYARKHAVTWFEDLAVHPGNLTEIKSGLRDFITGVDYVYLSLSLDVFPLAFAPGVGNPAAVGIPVELACELLRYIKATCAETGTRIILTDIAEMNPHYDIDQHTARLAARLVWELHRTK